MKKILFVCTGNTCRSSMAEAIAGKIIKDRGLDGAIDVKSAGIWATEGSRASWQAIEVMEQCGIDIRNHCARRITLVTLDESDLILTMTVSHKMSVLQIDPGAVNKVYTLIEYVDGREEDIQDPFGMAVETYRACAAELKKYIERAIDKLMDN